MPKTRNVTKEQWDAANASRTTKRSNDENKVRKDDDKENVGRPVTRASRTQGRTVFGNVLGSATAGNDLKPKVSSKGKKPVIAKKKKMPLQDITHQYLPAPESENRGEEFRGLDAEENNEQAPTFVIATAPAAEPIALTATEISPPIQLDAPTSPLPPSSPPTEWLLSPVVNSLPIASGSISGNHQLSRNVDLFGEWNEIPQPHRLSDDVSSASSRSDPFGFVALERDLKASRQHAPVAPAPQSDDDTEDLGEIIVADSSSPRPVRRLKRTHDDQAEEVNAEESYDVPEDAPVISATTAVPLFHPHAHFQTPPTPHKDKQKRRRLSYPGSDIYDPCSDSAPSSPSPSKPSTKRRAPAPIRDALDAFNERHDQDPELFATQLRKPKRPTHEDVKTPGPVSERVLRPRVSTSALSAPESESPIKPMKKLVGKTATKKPAGSAKKVKKPSKQTVEDEAALEKLEEARQERIEYFKRLESYEVETEDVYVI